MDNVNELVAALAKVQGKLPQVTKDKTATVQTKAGGTYSYSYADLATVMTKVLPILSEEGLAWITQPCYEGDNYILRYALVHTSGQSIEGTWPLPDPTQHGPQDVASALTYAKRYCFTSIVGVAADEDNDAQTAPKADRTKRSIQREDVDPNTGEVIDALLPQKELLRALAKQLDTEHQKDFVTQYAEAKLPAQPNGKPNLDRIRPAQLDTAIAIAEEVVADQEAQATAIDEDVSDASVPIATTEAELFDNDADEEADNA